MFCSCFVVFCSFLFEVVCIFLCSFFLVCFVFFLYLFVVFVVVFFIFCSLFVVCCGCSPLGLARGLSLGFGNYSLPRSDFGDDTAPGGAMPSRTREILADHLGRPLPTPRKTKRFGPVRSDSRGYQDLLPKF